VKKCTPRTPTRMPVSPRLRWERGAGNRRSVVHHTRVDVGGAQLVVYVCTARIVVDRVTLQDPCSRTVDALRYERVAHLTFPRCGAFERQLRAERFLQTFGAIAP
jgi:hypothetical protein